jgi:hypothetical protein
MDDTLEHGALIDKLGTYPHIQHKLTSMWGTKDCRDFIKGLIFNTSGRVTTSENGVPKNQGFPLGVILVITDILILHDTQYPEFGRKKIMKGKFVWD